ncbi:MAG TPA: flavin oxidoreductase/NADH oxidase [Negativicutes bacterium]|nr:flavin oxidoreductase/NADH oxidase [Negativicutes bacterium]
MSRHEKFHYADAAELKAAIHALGLEIPVGQSRPLLWAEPLKIGDKTVPNRLAVHPMEGCDGTVDGRPDELTFRRYERFARGGAGLLWFEATAVVPEGRAAPRQLLLNEATMPSLAALLTRSLAAASEAHGAAHRPYTVLQLTHSGRYSRPYGTPAAIIAANNPYLDSRLTPDHRIIGDAALEMLEDKYADAAELAATAGFDAVDVKCCHRYLINELHSAHTREGRYGGSFENRTRFIGNIVDKIKARVGDRLAIAVRMNAYDAIPYPYGWGVDKLDHNTPDFSEPQRLARILRDKGVKLINVTVGNPYYNPHVNRPYDSGTYTPPTHPLENVAVLLAADRAIQEAVPEVAVIGTGFSWLRQLGADVAAGCIGQGWFKLAGFGRQAFAYPDFAADLLATGRMDPQKVCVACGLCAMILRDGGTTGCVVRDAAVYGPVFKAGREGKPPVDGSRVSEHV